MTTYHSADRPWEIVRFPPAWTTELPDADDLNDEPQLATLALLQAISNVAVAALHSRHGVASDPSDELFKSRQCSAALIAHLIVIRCRELSDLLVAYRIAARHESDDSDDLF